MCKYYLGIDTSAYTTSLAVIDEDNNIILDLRCPLQVKNNEKGLRQQDAVFQHLNNFPILIESAVDKIDFNLIHTIAVSSKPRNLKDSYMPVFILGKNQAFILSKTLKTRYREFSHQEGHIGAYMAENTVDEPILSFHISGGTSELLLVENKENNLDIQLIGGSLDISFGQLIDRIGVYLGFQFPCGRELDLFSRNGKVLDINIPIAIKDGLWVNLSGLENYYKKLIDLKEHEPQDIVVTLFHTISRIIETLVTNAMSNSNVNKVLVTGGVSANYYIRKYLLNNGPNKSVEYVFPRSILSTDNAVGIAYLGKVKKGHEVINDEASKGL